MDSPEWVDTHGHLFLIDDDPAEVMARAAAAGVARVVCPGVDVPSSERSAALADEFPTSVLWSAGLHPHEARSWPSVRDRVAELAEEADAVGECGLDFYRNLAPRDAQIQAFVEQVAIATRLGKPIIIHCRDAFADVFGILSDADLGERAVLHCWTGGSRWTKRFAELGVMFSLAGPLTYDTAHTLRLAVAHVPPDRALVETDAPYLTPEPRRSQSNEPAFVTLTGAALADVWGTDIADVATTTTANANRVFGGPRA